jgi:Hypothetical protein FLILHELTA
MYRRNVGVKISHSCSVDMWLMSKAGLGGSSNASLARRFLFLRFCRRRIDQTATKGLRKRKCTLSSKSVFIGVSSVRAIHKDARVGVVGIQHASAPPSSMPQPGPPSGAGQPPRLPDRWEGYRDTLRKVALRTGQPLPSLALSFAVLHELTAIVPFVGIFFASRALGVGETVAEMLQEHDPQPGDVSEPERRHGAIKGYIRDKWREGGDFGARLGSRYGWFGFERGKKPTEGEKALMRKTMASDMANVMFAYVSVKV